MSQWRNLRVCILLLSVFLTLDCSRPGGLGDGGGPQAGQSAVPFEGSVQPSSSKINSADSSASGHESGGGPNFPLQNPLNLPAGTLVTVRLARPVSADELKAKGPFDAIIDEPVVIDGVTIIPRGAEAAGLVESARLSRLRHDRGYVRLTLASIQIAGRRLMVQTSSLFAKASPTSSANPAEEDSSDFVYLSKGRRLTFRLAGPLVLASQRETLAH